MELEQIQFRPGMYVGNTADGIGLDNMMAAVRDNAPAYRSTPIPNGT